MVIKFDFDGRNKVRGNKSIYYLSFTTYHLLKEMSKKHTFIPKGTMCFTVKREQLEDWTEEPITKKNWEIFNDQYGWSLGSAVQELVEQYYDEWKQMNAGKYKELLCDLCGGKDEVGYMGEKLTVKVCEHCDRKIRQ
mgnify:CR=1 FL=1